MRLERSQMDSCSRWSDSEQNTPQKISIFNALSHNLEKYTHIYKEKLNKCRSLRINEDQLVEKRPILTHRTTKNLPSRSLAPNRKDLESL